MDPIRFSQSGQVPTPIRTGKEPYRFSDRHKVALVLDAVAAEYGTTIERLQGRGRDLPANLARQAATILLSQLLTITNSEIGRILGGRDHSRIAEARAKLPLLILDTHWRECYEAAYRSALIELEAFERGNATAQAPGDDDGFLPLVPVQVASYQQVPVVIVAVTPSRRRCRVRFAGSPPAGLPETTILVAGDLRPPPRLVVGLDELTAYASFWSKVEESGLTNGRHQDQYHRAKLVLTTLRYGEDSEPVAEPPDALPGLSATA